MGGSVSDKQALFRREFLRYLAASTAGFPLLSCAAPRLAANMSGRSLADRRLEDPVNIFDLEAIAEANIPPAHWGSLQTGVLDDATVRANRAGFNKFGVRARRLSTPRTVDTSVTLFGETYATPILCAPVSAQKAFHPDGEIAVARAARAKNTLQILSTGASSSIEDVMAAREGPAWFQLYAMSEREAGEAILARAELAGAQAIVLTVDLLGGGMRRETVMRYIEHDTRDCTACHGPEANEGRRQRVNAPMYDGIDRSRVSLSARWVTWDYVARLRDICRGRLLLKGIVTGEDAALAADYGVDAIVVSNHGGRAEESLISTIEVLPEVAEAVNGRIPVLIDSGFRRGADVFKALALGATAVCIGRPHCYGLGAFGQEGVEMALDMMTTELASLMSQVGVGDIRSITSDHVRRIA